MGILPMPRQVTTVSFSFSSLRLRAFALICCSLLASSASAGYPPETEALRPPTFSLDLLPAVVYPVQVMVKSCATWSMSGDFRGS